MTWTILQADARQIPLADKSVQCVVTSPPYWGLRDYGTATWVGGDDGCDHKQTTARHDGGRANVNGFHSSLTADSDKGAMNYRDECKKCGATRIDSQIGLEATPETYVEKIVAVFREVWRVLRDDGTCWVNLGDSYAGSLSSNEFRDAKHWTHTFDKPLRGSNRNGMGRVSGLKPKDLVGIPWRVAFALQAAGWYLRSDIIWSKPNPMPESVTDRPTKAHEYIFLLTKKERYFFDQDAVREPCPDNKNHHMKSGRNFEADPRETRRADLIAIGEPPTARNIRTVWEIATQPYPEAHFATFPEEIAKRCILAGTSERGACGGWAGCGAPWERVTEANYIQHRKPWNDSKHPDGRNAEHGDLWAAQYGSSTKANVTTGWQRTCKHDAPTVPCIVLDPFSGAGTVALVADKLNRRGIGLELKADYCRMASRRCYDDAPLLAGVIE